MSRTPDGLSSGVPDASSLATTWPAAARLLPHALAVADHASSHTDMPEAAQPQVALYLARGQTALAAARPHRRLNQVGRDTLPGVPLLAQLIDVQLAQGDHVGAQATAETLVGIAERSRRERVQAEAELPSVFANFPEQMPVRFALHRHYGKC